MTDETAEDENLLRSIYETAKTIRCFDDRVRRGLGSGEFAFNYWPVEGQEAISAGVCAALAPDDRMLATYRGAADVIGKGVPLEAYASELLGKATGTSGGKGGGDGRERAGGRTRRGHRHRRCGRPDRQRHRSRLAAQGRWPRHGRVLRRRRDEHRCGPRGDEPGGALEPARHLPVPQQPLRRGHADRRVYEDRAAVRSRRRLRHARCDRRRHGRAGRPRGGAGGGRSRAPRRGADLPRGGRLPAERPLLRGSLRLCRQGGARACACERADREAAREAGRGG